MAKAQPNTAQQDAASPQAVPEAANATPGPAMSAGPGEGAQRPDGLAVFDPVVTHVHVRATVPEGFCRANRRWPGGEGIEVPIEEVGDDGLIELLAEPMLVVTPIAAGDPAGAVFDPSA